MSLQTVSFRRCDICLNKIDPYYENGQAMIDDISENQVWTVGDKVYDVCVNCCLKLMDAKRLGLISYDEDALYLAAGWVRAEGGHWVKR